LISEEEVRPFLMANFLSSRVMSKIVTHPSSMPPSSSSSSDSANRGLYLVAGLHRYEWIVKFAPKIAERRGMNLSDFFREEYQIAQDMMKLLPSKIDRMCYMGESGLAL
jgi:hypothetical protein